jgi:membrane protein YdbS with pleckstrin-like domain
MKYFLTLFCFVLSGNKLLFAGGVASSSQDKYMLLIIAIILILFLVIPKIYKYLKIRLGQFFHWHV